MLVELKTLEEIEQIDQELYNKIIENNRYIEIECYNWYDHTVEYFQHQVLQPQGLEGSDLTFDLYFRDANLKYLIMDMKKFLDANITKREYNYLLGKSIEIERITDKYYITNYDPLEIEYYSRNELKARARDMLEDSLMMLFENKIDYIDHNYYEMLTTEGYKRIMDEIREELNRELLERLNKDYELLTSDEMIREILTEDEILFDKNGSIVDPF